MKKSVLLLAFVFTMILSMGVFAAGEISLYVDRLNYWDSESHTFTVSNNGAESVQVTYAIHPGWSWVSGSNCIDTGAATCTVASGGTAAFTLSSPASSTEYQMTVMYPSITNNSYTEANNVTLIKINPDEIFHTLVEFGRGRGNYFYDSGFERSGSGKSRPGCTYLPNGTMFELNFLHKVHNVQQYLELAVAEGENATFSCTYEPNVTVVRKHLITSISRGTQWNIDYLLPEISSSWERMGYVGMDYDETDLNTGDTITSNCTDLVYALPGAYGDVQVDYTDLVFTVIDKDPFSVSAFSSQTIGNGTQEVEITYQITNNAPTGFDSVIFEIDAPQYASFIGTRGELWGTARESYRIEKLEIAAGETETVTLVARFDTSAASGINSIPLSQGVTVSFVPCWEINAYNPAEYLQYLAVTDNGTVDLGTNTTVTDVIERINSTYILVSEINSTTYRIEDTVNIINASIEDINNTVNLIWDTVTVINGTVNDIYTNVSLIYENTETLIEMLDCDGVNDSVICDFLLDINISLTELTDLVNIINVTTSEINTTLYAVNETMIERFDEINNTLTYVYNEVIVIDGKVTNLTNIVNNLVNCTYNDGNNSMICQYLQQIDETTSIINGTVTIINGTVEDINNTITEIEIYVGDINSTVNEFYDYMNNTVWGNLTAQDLMDRFDIVIELLVNLTEDVEQILVDITRMREFQEEMVFLITDSIVSQREARSALSNGDVGTATAKLTEANDRLVEVTDMILEREASLASGEEVTASVTPYERPSKGWFGWLVPLFIVVAAVVLGIYLFSRTEKRF